MKTIILITICLLSLNSFSQDKCKSFDKSEVKKELDERMQRTRQIYYTTKNVISWEDLVEIGNNHYNEILKEKRATCLKEQLQIASLKRFN